VADFISAYLWANQAVTGDLWAPVPAGETLYAHMRDQRVYAGAGARLGGSIKPIDQISHIKICCLGVQSTYIQIPKLTNPPIIPIWSLFSFSFGQVVGMGLSPGSVF